MEINFKKIIALVATIVYVGVLIEGKGGYLNKSAVQNCSVAVIALVLIWFPNELGEITGIQFKGQTIDQQTPGIFISFMGWVWLLGWPLVLYWMR